MFKKKNLIYKLQNELFRTDDGRWFKAVISLNFDAPCKGCDFHTGDYCGKYACATIHRRDKINVVFKLMGAA